jgi:hypothetical protein
MHRVGDRLFQLDVGFVRQQLPDARKWLRPVLLFTAATDREKQGIKRSRKPRLAPRDGFPSLVRSTFRQESLRRCQRKAKPENQPATILARKSKGSPNATPQRISI